MKLHSVDCSVATQPAIGCRIEFEDAGNEQKNQGADGEQGLQVGEISRGVHGLSLVFSVS